MCDEISIKLNGGKPAPACNQCRRQNTLAGSNLDDMVELLGCDGADDGLDDGIVAKKILAKSFPRLMAWRASLGHWNIGLHGCG